MKVLTDYLEQLVLHRLPQIFSSLQYVPQDNKLDLCALFGLPNFEPQEITPFQQSSISGGRSKHKKGDTEKGRP
jgi:hypothetical protein